MLVDDTTSEALNTSSETQNVYFLFWSEFIQITQRLVESIRTDGSPQVIIGLQRGGLIPAVRLSHLLGVRQFLSLPVSRTTSDAIFAHKITPSVMQMQPGLIQQYITNKDILIVDDIAGTGQSVKEVLRLLTSFGPTRIRSAICVINRDNWDPHNAHQPTEMLTYIGKEIHGWAVFPWEMPPDMYSLNINHVQSNTAKSHNA